MADPLTIASIMSAIGTTVSNIAMSQQQKKYNEQLQDKQNQYNSPSEQIERLKAAGVSPNSLTMGNGSVVTGNTSAGANPYQLPNIQDPMSMITNSMLTGEQGKTENEMRELRKQEAAAQIATLKANAEKLGVDTKYQSILNTFASAKEMAAIEGQRASTRLTHWQTAKVKQEGKNLAAELGNILKQYDLMVAQENLTVGQLDLLFEDIANKQADTALKKSQTGTQEAQKELIEAQSEGQEMSNERYTELTDAILSQYQATVNKLAADCDLTEQEAFYYLYELTRKYGIKFMGVPVPGQGGFREINLNEKLQKDAIGKYGASGLKTDNIR